MARDPCTCGEVLVIGGFCTPSFRGGWLHHALAACSCPYFVRLWAIAPQPTHVFTPSRPRSRLRRQPYLRFKRLIRPSPPARNRGSRRNQGARSVACSAAVLGPVLGKLQCS